MGVPPDAGSIQVFSDHSRAVFARVNLSENDICVFFMQMLLFKTAREELVQYRLQFNSAVKTTSTT